MNINVLPPDVEAIVITNFDHPGFGAALRAFPSKYHTRALFDLHYARIKSARDPKEPSFEQILNTDLTGIEETLIGVIDAFPGPPKGPNILLTWLARRKYPGAVPRLLESLRTSYPSARTQSAHRMPAALFFLLEYPSVEVWRSARDALTALFERGVIAKEDYDADAKMLDNRLANPQAALAEIRQRTRFAQYQNAEALLRPTLNQIERFRNSDPSRHATEYGAYLEKFEPIVADYADVLDDYSWLALRYFELATRLRFFLQRPEEAVKAYERAGMHGHVLGLVAAGDTWQFDLGNKRNAIRSYERALQAPLATFVPKVPNRYRPDAGRMLAWLKAWLPNEIRFLESGQRRYDGPSDDALTGLFDLLLYYGGRIQFAPGLPELVFRRLPNGPEPSMPVRRVDPRFLTEAALAKVRPDDLARQLDALPASRLTLLGTIEHASVLNDPKRILAYFMRHDPSGYWSAALFASIRRQPESATQAMPGLVAPTSAEPRAINVAAERFVRERGGDR
jgi:hypothetical protein